MDNVLNQIALEKSQVYLADGSGGLFAATTIEKLPDKVLLNIFSYLTHREICSMARVCKKWRMVAYDTRLWKCVSLRPEISGLHVGSLESLLALISIRFGPSLRYIELPIELITHTVLHELANKCPNLTHMLLDFSTAMQLHDFSELQGFPTKLKYLCICLSEVIFMEGFMRKIYNFINGLEILHLVGTYEKVEEEEEEVYEVINVHKLKSATPNLKVINLYGINFIDDSHIDAFSSNCIQLECLAVNYCSKVTGSTLKILFARNRRLRCLLLNGTSLQSEYLMQVEWEKCAALLELDVTATDLSTEALTDMLSRLPGLRFLSAGQLNGFTDSVLKAWMEVGNARNLMALDLDCSDNMTDDALYKFLSKHGQQLHGLCLSGMTHVTDSLWQSVLPILTNARILVMGTPERLAGNVLIDQLMDGIANNCPKLERLELRWDPDNLRFSDKSQKAIDTLRVKCLNLRSLVISDGRYYEIVKANFERADRMTVVRTLTNCRVSNYYLLETLGKVFAPARYDMNGNIEKVAKKYNEDHTKNEHLEDMLLAEKKEGNVYATDALMWLRRGLHFNLEFFEGIVNDAGCQQDLSPFIKAAYSATLEKYHGWFGSNLFGMLSRLVPQRKLLFKYIALDKDGCEEHVVKDMQAFTINLRVCVVHLIEFYKENGLEMEAKV